MPEGLVVDSQSELKEFRESGFPRQPAPIRWAASFISFIFHPIFIPLYVTGFIVFIHPYLFAGFSEWDKTKVLIQAFVNYTFFPLVTVLLLKGLKFIESVQLRSQRDRVFPYVACMIWYFWIWNVWRHLEDYPAAAVKFSLAIFVASIFGLLANIFMKISMHAIAIGVMITFMILLAIGQTISFSLYISIALLIAGLVCTSRFIVSDHTRKEVYGGLFAGILAQLISSWLG